VIGITQEELKKILSYSQDSGLFVWIRVSKYHNEKRGKIAGGVCESRGKYYKVIRINRRGYKAHRLAWIYVYGREPKCEIDHINGDSLDNRIINLREANRFQNTQNHSRVVNNSGLPIGVRNTPGGKYQARITANNKLYYLGTFDSIGRAKKAYKEARGRLHDAPIFNGARQ